MHEKTQKLLLVEDDAAMSSTLCRTLKNRGWIVLAIEDGNKAIDAWKHFEPDAVLLDLTLPGLDGLEILAQARHMGLETPVLILTARGTVGDRVLGLNSGADDYLPKPFDLDELDARIRALLRRKSLPQYFKASDQQPRAADLLASKDMQSFGGLTFDSVSGAFYTKKQLLELAPREALMLSELFVRNGRAVRKEHLFEIVFANELDVHFEAIEVVAYRLRKKLLDTGVQLVTLRGLGYLLKLTESVTP